MKKISVVEYLIKELNKLGINEFFGLPGDFNFNILDAIENNPNTLWIGSTNELNAGYAADGYARVRGYGAVVTTYNVGELSAMNAIAGSYAENVPVISIVGAPKTKFIESNALVHHNYCRPDYFAGIRSYSNVTETTAFLNNENAKSEIDRILTVFIREKRPVYVAIPVDVCNYMIEDIPDIEESTSDENNLRDALNHAMALISRAQSPVIIGDVLTKRHQAKEEFNRLVEKSGYPTTTLIMGKGLISEDSKYYMGTYLASLDNLDVYNTVNNSDCVISVGTIYSDFNTFKFDIRFKAADFIEIFGNFTTIENKLYKNVQMKDILRHLSERISYQKFDIKKSHPDLGSSIINEERKLDFDYIAPRFQEFLKPNDHIIAETGLFDYFAAQLSLPKNAELDIQLLWASIGWATPATFGASIGDRYRRFILLTGEGSHQLTFQSLSEILHRKLKPIIIVLNNSGYSIERILSKNPEDAYNDIIPWNYTKLLDAFEGDVWTAKAKTNKEFDSALKQAEIENKDKMCYIEIFTDKMDLPQITRKYTAKYKMLRDRDKV